MYNRRNYQTNPRHTANHPRAPPKRAPNRPPKTPEWAPKGQQAHHLRGGHDQPHAQRRARHLGTLSGTGWWAAKKHGHSGFLKFLEKLKILKRSGSGGGKI